MLVDVHVIDVILALIVIEAVGVLALRALTGRGPAVGAFVSNLLAGAFLFLALRCTLAGAPAQWVAASLLAALAAHLADLVGRWEAPRKGADDTLHATVSVRIGKPKSRHAPRAQRDESSDV